jgi:hypothetical protein
LLGWKAVKARYHCGILHTKNRDIVYKLTERAADDFAGIYDYTLLKFGEAQATIIQTHLRHFSRHWPECQIWDVTTIPFLV